MVLALTVLVTSFAFVTPAATQTAELLHLGFRQDFNNYFWQTRFAYQMPANQRHQLSVAEVYRANLLETTAQTDKWKDDHQFQFDYRYRLNRWLRVTSILNSTIFTDWQTGFLNNSRTHFLGGGLLADPKSIFRINSYAGWKSDQRYHRTSNALHYQIQTNSLPFQLADYSNQLNVDLQGDEFRQRRDQDVLLQYRVSREFYQNTADSLSYQMGYRKRVYFISEQGDLESRLERDNNLTNWLNYQVSERLAWTLFTQISYRSSNVDQIIAYKSIGSRERQDTGIQWESFFIWKTRHLRTSIGWSTISQNQNFQTSQALKPSPSMGSIGMPDNKNMNNTLRGVIAWQAGTRDTVSAHFLISRFQYDTPDSNNFDDRDEFRTTMMLRYSHLFSPALNINVETKANLHHLVYLFAERSANNNWNRIFQLSTQLFYQPAPLFRWQQQAEILANYTSYDFEEIQTQIRSYVYRKFTLADSVLAGDSTQFHFLLFHRLELEENGRLFWQEFAEQLLLNRQNHYLVFNIQYPLVGELVLNSGFTAYIRREWRYEQDPRGETIKKKWGDFISYGPQIRLFLNRNSKRQALVSISRLRVKPPRERDYFLNQIDLNVHWFF